MQNSFRLWLSVAWHCGWLTCGILQTRAAAADWLLDNSPYKARIEVSDDGREAILSNGLIRRVLRLMPNASTVAFDDLRTGQSLLRCARSGGGVGWPINCGGRAGGATQPRFSKTRLSRPAALRSPVDVARRPHCETNSRAFPLETNPCDRSPGGVAVFNPLDSAAERTPQVNVYYTGLTGKLTLKDTRDQIRRVAVNRDNTILVTVSTPAGGFDDFILEE